MYDNVIEAMVPAIVTIASFLFALACVAVALHFRSKRIKEEQETIRMAMEKGIELPTELFQKTNRRGNGGPDSLRRGIFYMMVGIALFIALYVSAGIRGAVWALLPLAIGLGYLLYHFMSPQTAKNRQ
jgi:hypothetical protein